MVDPSFEDFLEIAHLAELPCADLAIAKFCSWLEENELSFKKVNTRHAKQFKEFLSYHEYTDKQARAILRVMNAYYTWLHHSPDLSPFRRVSITVVPKRVPKAPKHAIKVLSQLQIDMVRATIQKSYSSPYEYFRAYTIMAMMLYLGIPSRELCRMRITDVRGKGAYLFWQDKTIPYTPQMKYLITQYLAHRAAKTDYENEWLFQRGANPSTHTALRKTLEEISRLGRVYITEKMLLDTFAYNLALDGAPAALIVSMRRCKVSEAEEFISLAANSEEISTVYLRSVEQRMRPAKRRRPRQVE